MVETRCWIIGQGIIHHASWVRELGSRRENRDFDANGWMYMYLFAGICMSIVQQTQPYRRLPDRTHGAPGFRASILPLTRRSQR